MNRSGNESIIFTNNDWSILLDTGRNENLITVSNINFIYSNLFLKLLNIFQNHLQQAINLENME